MIKPMLAKLVDEIPPGMLYEPKWDGFRALVRDGEIYSRNGKPLARYFPELVAAFARQLEPGVVVDGEIVVVGESGRLDFFALQQRIHPAGSRVARLAEETPARFIAFDLPGERPFAERRAALERMGFEPPLYVTPLTSSLDVARDWFARFEGAGLDGVIAKDGSLPYQPGVRAMYKIKHQRTAECVVCGYRLHKTQRDGVGSLLLGLYDDGHGPPWASQFGGLQPIGATAAFTAARRRALLSELRPLEIEASSHPWGAMLVEQTVGNRWNPAREAQFVALDPVRVVEVRYDHMDGGFLRHPATFLRWRDDRDAASCGFEQLERPAAWSFADIIR